MTTGVVVIGCGGHGREIYRIVDAVNAASANGPRWRTIGFVDDRPSATNLKRIQGLGTSYLGSTGWLRSTQPDTCVVVGIGDPRVRRTVARRVEAYGIQVASLIHPDATVDADTFAGEGLVAFAGVRVTTNVRLGRHVHLNQNATVGHDCVLGDFVSVNPLAAVSGECQLGNGVLIGTNAAVLQGVRIGEDATAGAGAVVVRDVASAAIVKGVPAR